MISTTLVTAPLGYRFWSQLSLGQPRSVATPTRGFACSQNIAPSHKDNWRIERRFYTRTLIL